MANNQTPNQGQRNQYEQQPTRANQDIKNPSERAQNKDLNKNRSPEVGSESEENM